MVALTLASAPSNARAQPKRAPDPATLFGPGGVLSPGFVAAHPRATAAPLDLHEQESRVPRVSVLFNPALAPYGKWAARLEVAPFRAHALFVEVSTVQLPGDVSVSGTEIDIGYHLFPLEGGLSGFYIGPRYVHGTGESDYARGTVNGVGGDLGFQWVIGVVAINVGAGAAWVKVKIDPKTELLSNPDIPDAIKAAVPSPVDTTRVVPLATVGLGVAF